MNNGIQQTNEQIKEKYADKIIEMLEAGKLPSWKKSWNNNSRPKNYFTNKPYHGYNLFMLLFSDFTSQYWATYTQVMDTATCTNCNKKYLNKWLYQPIKKWGKCCENPTADRFVKKGAEGFFGFKVGRYIPRIFMNKYGLTQQDVIAILNGTKYQQINEPIIATYLKSFYLFNYDQIEGLPAKDKQQIEFNPIEKCEETINLYTNKPAIEHTGSQPCYKPSVDKIEIPAKNYFTSIPEYYSTLFHELAHSTGHENRLNRLKHDAFGSHTYSKEELIAEFTNAFLCGRTGIEQGTLENSASYIQSWLKVLKNDKSILIDAIQEAKKAYSYMTHEEEV